VIITGAFIAEEAEVVDAKLNVRGGVVDSMPLPPEGYAVPMHLVVLLQAGPEDVDRPYRTVVEVVAPDGTQTTLIDQDIAVGAHRGVNRFWQWPIVVAAPTTGRISFLITIGGTTLAVPIEVVDES
jgi:hypothetical protein